MSDKINIIDELIKLSVIEKGEIEEPYEGLEDRLTSFVNTCFEKVELFSNIKNPPASSPYTYDESKLSLLSELCYETLHLGGKYDEIYNYLCHIWHNQDKEFVKKFEEGLREELREWIGLEKFWVIKSKVTGCYYHADKWYMNPIYASRWFVERKESCLKKFYKLNDYYNKFSIEETDCNFKNFKTINPYPIDLYSTVSTQDLQVLTKKFVLEKDGKYFSPSFPDKVTDNVKNASRYVLNFDNIVDIRERNCSDYNIVEHTYSNFGTDQEKLEESKIILYPHKWYILEKNGKYYNSPNWQKDLDDDSKSKQNNFVNIWDTKDYAISYRDKLVPEANVIQIFGPKTWNYHTGMENFSKEYTKIISAGAKEKSSLPKIKEEKTVSSNITALFIYKDGKYYDCYDKTWKDNADDVNAPWLDTPLFLEDVKKIISKHGLTDVEIVSLNGINTFGKQNAYEKLPVKSIPYNKYYVLHDGIMFYDHETGLGSSTPIKTSVWFDDDLESEGIISVIKKYNKYYTVKEIYGESHEKLDVFTLKDVKNIDKTDNSEKKPVFVIKHENKYLNGDQIEKDFIWTGNIKESFFIKSHEEACNLQLKYNIPGSIYKTTAHYKNNVLVNVDDVINVVEVDNIKLEKKFILKCEGKYYVRNRMYTATEYLKEIDWTSNIGESYLFASNDSARQFRANNFNNVDIVECIIEIQNGKILKIKEVQIVLEPKVQIKPSSVLDEVKEVADIVKWRIIQRQVMRRFKSGIYSMLKNNDKKEVKALKKFLNSRIGEGLLASMIGFSGSKIDKLSNNENASKLLKEFRVEGLSAIGDDVFERAIQSILPIFIKEKELKALPNLRVTEDKTEEMEEEILELKEATV